jgi:hypothetical protein
MSNVHERPETGQCEDLTDERDPIEFLKGFWRYLDENMDRIQAACARVEARVKAERAVENAEELPAPPFATRSDGAVLLSTDAIDGVDVAAYEKWEGIVLPGWQAHDVLDAIDGPLHDAAARIAARMRKRREDDGENES